MTLTKEQAEHLLNAIEKNFEWAKSKGLSINDPRLFIENIIRHAAGFAEWFGDANENKDN